MWHCKIHSRDEIALRNLNETTSEEGIHDLEKIINNPTYCNKIDANHQLDYPSENDECLKIQSLEEIVVTIIENPVEVEVKDDSVTLEPIAWN